MAEAGLAPASHVPAGPEPTTLRLGVDVADLATPRALRRFELLTNAFGGETIEIIKLPRPPVREAPDRPGSGKNGGETRRLQVGQARGATGSPAQPPLDAVLALGDGSGRVRALSRCCSTWILVDDDGVGDLSTRTGRHRVGMTLRQVQTRGRDLHDLARCEVARRPWDSLERLQWRLDDHLPLLIREACRRRSTGPTAAATMAHGTRTECRWMRANLAERLRDVRYLSHLVAAAFPARLHQDEAKIICLHDPAPDVLDDLLAKLRPFLAYSEAVDAIRECRPLPPGTVVTFDDGYHQNMALLDVLDHHCCPAMFFLSTRVVDTDDAFWFMSRENRTPRQKDELRRLDYRAYLTASLAPQPQVPRRLALTSDEIRELAKRGHEVGVHTHNHPFLSRHDVDVHYEITECHRRLRATLGRDRLPLHVAYPDGDYNQAVVRMLRALGAGSAVTTRPALLADAGDLLALPRYVLGDADYPGLAVLKMTRSYGLLRMLQGRHCG